MSTERVKEAQQKSGEIALKYCLENGLLAWYIIGSMQCGRMPASKYISSGPYTSTEAMLAKGQNDDDFWPELLSPEEAKKLIY